MDHPICALCLQYCGSVDGLMHHMLNTHDHVHARYGCDVLDDGVPVHHLFLYPTAIGELAESLVSYRVNEVPKHEFTSEQAALDDVVIDVKPLTRYVLMVRRWLAVACAARQPCRMARRCMSRACPMMYERMAQYTMLRND